MTGFYPYLISSLPALSFETKPPLSFENFLEMCGRFISSNELRIIESVQEKVLLYDESNSFLKQWYDFDFGLRNELVNFRANRKNIDSARYLRGSVQPDSNVVHSAALAARAPGLLEAEKILDTARWVKIDEITQGHFFDLCALFGYAIKLRINLKWNAIRSADRVNMLKDNLKAVGQQPG